VDNGYADLAPGSYSRYYLDSLAPAPIGTILDDALVGPTSQALELLLRRVMVAQGYDVASLWVDFCPERLALLPFGWVMLRAYAVVVEFDVVIEDLDPLTDDPDETFDVEVDDPGPGLSGWWPNG